MKANHTEFLQLLNGAVQYVVPRWQRRYCWDETDIERLVEDLLTIAGADRPGAAHYGGALLTFPESTTAGGVPIHRVVDGQQRLTTVSILLACIADVMGSGETGGWTEQLLRDRLTNHPSHPPQKRRKLRLQDGDEDEFRRGLEGNPGGPGAVAQAWRIARRLVNQSDVATLLKGIERFRVVAIALDATDDPQQIFESLNATGRPLTESEKVKNWLLMGLEDEEQQDLHDNHWIGIERKLGVERTTEPVDVFLRDFLRWRTGRNLGITRVHEELRRWALRGERDQDRPALCRELARLAGLYGILTGTAGPHSDGKVERALRHLRAMEIHTHRPFTLRLLDDVARREHAGATHEALATVLEGVGTWITRLWLANRALAGLNTAATELAHGPGPEADADYAEHWIARIRRLRNTRVGVPGDDEVRDGIRNRKAYGGSATRSSFALLCALMETEHWQQAPARNALTIEHILPRKLTDDWKQDLGDAAEDVHGRWRDRLANLTLSGADDNAGMGARTFAAKRKVYNKSTIGMTRRVAANSKWHEEALERRAMDLADRALKRWPWQDTSEPSSAVTAPLRWRIGDGPWRGEPAASRMVLEVAGALLSMDPANAEKLSGDAISSNVHPASRYPPGTKAGALTMRAVSGHAEYVLFPYRGDYQDHADFCKKMGERCGVQVGVEFEDGNPTHAFWEFFKERAGAVSGKTTVWRSATQRTAPVNTFGDRIRIHAGKQLLRLDIVVEESNNADRTRAQRAREFSQVIRDSLSDQVVEDDRERGQQGFSASVERTWTRDDKDGWAEATRWIRDQHDRLRAIANAPVT